MSLFDQTRERFLSVSRIFLLGGPLGLFYVGKQAWIARQMKRVRLYMDRERDLHRQHMAQLNQEMNDLISAQQGINIAAAQFQRYCEKQAGGQA